MSAKCVTDRDSELDGAISDLHALQARMSRVQSQGKSISELVMQEKALMFRIRQLGGVA